MSRLSIVIARTFAAAAVSTACSAFAQTGGGSPADTPTAPNARPDTTMTAPATPPMSNMESGKSQGDAKLSSYDKRFMSRAAEAGLAEVEMGKLATQKASSPEVKQYAQQMVDQHTKANQELQQLASGKSVELPSKPNASHRRALKTLQNASGTEFDQKYMTQAGVKSHKEAVDLFQGASQKAQDPQVKEWATTTLKTIQQHDQLAHQIADTQKGEKASGNGKM